MREGLSLKSCAALLMGTVVSVAGISAGWIFATENADKHAASHEIVLKDWIYTPEEMPDVEVSVVQRLSDILNQRYQTDVVADSLDYLINETIQVFWNNNPAEDPFVGSMDTTYATQIAELFEDVLFESGVSFILKNQDLNGDGYREIAMYSTSDPLDNTSSSYKGVVCVYVTVFTPVVNSAGQVTGYQMACESLRGYCSEIYYSPRYHVPSFSTDTWRDSVGYKRGSRVYELPDSAKMNFDSYNLTYNRYTTEPMGNTLGTVLSDVL